MRSLFDSGAEQDLVRRIDRLSADAGRRWGKMSAPEMICHLTDSYRVLLGEMEARRRKSFLRFAPARWLFVHLLPWPRGKVQTASEFLTTKPADWQRDLENLKRALARLGERGRAADPEWGTHPVFGPMSDREYGLLAYKHTDYHLRQFGV